MFVFKPQTFGNMPVLIDGKMCLPTGGKVHQLDSRDARIAAVAMSIPLLLTFAGLISCGTGIVSEQITTVSPLFGTFGATAIIGYQQIRVILAGPNGLTIDQTGYIVAPCAGRQDSCPTSADPAVQGNNICIPATSMASFTASKVFGSFAIILQIVLPVLMFLKKINNSAFAALSWAIIVFLVIFACCAVLGLQQIETCEDSAILKGLTDPSFTASFTTLILPGANSVIAAIFFQFFLWMYVQCYAKLESPNGPNANGLKDPLNLDYAKA